MTGGVRGGEQRKVAASFLFHPLFVIIPLGQTVHFIKKGEGTRERKAIWKSDLIKEIKCRSLKF